MAASPRVRRIPPKKLQPSKWLRLEGAGAAVVLVEVLVEVLSVVVVVDAVVVVLVVVQIVVVVVSTKVTMMSSSSSTFMMSAMVSKGASSHPFHFWVRSSVVVNPSGVGAPRTDTKQQHTRRS